MTTTTKEIIGKMTGPNGNFQYVSGDVLLNSYELGLIITVTTEKAVAQITIECTNPEGERWHPDIAHFFQAIAAARKIHTKKLVQDEDGTPYCKECGEQHGRDIRGEPGSWEWEGDTWDVRQFGDFYEISGPSASIVLHIDHVLEVEKAGKRMWENPETDWMFECPEEMEARKNSIDRPAVGDVITDEIERTVFGATYRHEQEFHRADKLRGWIKHQKKRAEEFEKEGDTRGLKICKKLIGNFEKELKEIEG